LKRATQTLAEAMYRERRGGAPHGPGSPGAPPNGDVVDAEFRHIDDQKQ
jgi:hypothetical protein